MLEVEVEDDYTLSTAVPVVTVVIAEPHVRERPTSSQTLPRVGERRKLLSSHGAPQGHDFGDVDHIIVTRFRLPVGPRDVMEGRDSRAEGRRPPVDQRHPQRAPRCPQNPTYTGVKSV